MLVHLSNTSPYICDLNRGPIEQANRMASAPTKKATALLEQKESFPKLTRTPLKLLAPDEVPMDSTLTTADINASLQPIWYTEQTIAEDQHEDIASIIREQQGKSILPRTTLPPIPSESPSISEEIEELPNQPSLMHKSSTFTIETLTNVDSEKENTTNQIIQPSDDSFRALEQLLGLGSTTTVRDSPKTNHDTLSLTVVTPTDIINSTRRSSRLSYAPQGSLPSSQDIPTMPTIESITSADPPSFLMNNTTMGEEQPATTMNQQPSFDITDNDTIKDDSNNDDETNFSFELNDFPNNSKNESMVNLPEPPPPMITIRAPTCADVAYRALIKPRAGGRVSQPLKADSPLAKPNKLRSSAPTARMLRSSCRRISADSPSQNTINQEQQLPLNPECFVNDNNTNTELVEVLTLPEEDENEQEKTTSVTLNITSSKETEEINQNTSVQSEQISTPMKPVMSVLSREYTYNTPKRRSSQRHRSMLNSAYATPMQTEQTPINEEESNSPSIASKSMLDILLTKPTEVQPRGLRKTSMKPSPIRTSTRNTINEGTINSPSIASKSMLNILLTKPTEAEPKALGKISSARTSRRTIMNDKTPNSPSIASKSMLEILLTKPTEVQPNVLQNTSIVSSSTRTSRRTIIREEATNSPSIASKSMLGILLTNPTEDQPSIVQHTSVASSPVRVSTRKSGHLSSNPTPRASINPLHSSTPSSTRHKSLQMVSIGEQEQVLTTVPQQIDIVPLNDTEASIQQPSTIEMGVQTTPSLDVSSRRRLNAIQQPTTPILQMNKSSSMVIVDEEKQITSLQTNVIMNLQRSVRFQLTPATDARLVAKEQMEENLRGLKPDIVINSAPILLETKLEKVKSVQIKKIAKPKRKRLATTKKTGSKSQPIQKKSRQPQKVKPIKQQKASPATKRASRKRTIPKATMKQIIQEATIKPIVKQTSRKRAIPAVKTERAPPKRTIPEATTEQVAKRASRKRAIPAVKTERALPKRTIPEATTEQVAKRASRKRAIPAVKTERALPKRTIPEATTEQVAKRASRKRTMPAATTEPIAKRAPPKQIIPEATIAKRVPPKRTTAEITTEPIAKRAKTSKSVEIKKQPIEVPLPPSNLPKTRSRSTNNKENLAQRIEREPTIKTSKRRLQSVEKTKELKKKAEEKAMQSIPAVQNPELSQQERQKIEALTVTGLKSRLNTLKKDIPKGAKKADLIALLIKIETNLLHEGKQIETTPTTTGMTTRRRRKN